MSWADSVDQYCRACLFHGPLSLSPESNDSSLLAHSINQILFSLPRVLTALLHSIRYSLSSPHCIDGSFPILIILTFS